MENVVRLTKSGKPVWSSKEERAECILGAIESEGYSTNLSLEDLMKGKFYVARSATTITNHIEEVLRTQKQLNKYLQDWNSYSHFHDYITTINRDYFELVAVRNLLGSDAKIKL